MTKQQLGYFRPYINNQDRLENGAKYKHIKQNEHHPVASSRVVADTKQQTIELFMPFHSNFHGVFGNGVFQEQLEQLRRVNTTVLSDKIMKDLEEIINMNDEYVYKDGIYIKR